MLGRRTLLGAALALPAALLARWLPGQKSSDPAGQVSVEEQPNRWRVIRYHEGKTWFDIRFRLDHDDHPAFGLQQVDEDGSRCDIDWWRLVQPRNDGSSWGLDYASR